MHRWSVFTQFWSNILSLKIETKWFSYIPVNWECVYFLYNRLETGRIMIWLFFRPPTVYAITQKYFSESFQFWTYLWTLLKPASQLIRYVYDDPITHFRILIIPGAIAFKFNAPGTFVLINIVPGFQRISKFYFYGLWARFPITLIKKASCTRYLQQKKFSLDFIVGFQINWGKFGPSCSQFECCKRVPFLFPALCFELSDQVRLLHEDFESLCEDDKVTYGILVC